MRLQQDQLHAQDLQLCSWSLGTHSLGHCLQQCLHLPVQHKMCRDEYQGKKTPILQEQVGLLRVFLTETNYFGLLLPPGIIMVSL